MVWIVNGSKNLVLIGLYNIIEKFLFLIIIKFDWDVNGA